MARLYRVSTTFINSEGKQQGDINLYLDEEDLEEFKKADNKEQVEWIITMGESTVDLELEELEAGTVDINDIVIAETEVPNDFDDDDEFEDDSDEDSDDDYDDDEDEDYYDADESEDEEEDEWDEEE
jgi:hypothetical protein